MRAEVIIAARGELPENLSKTIEGVHATKRPGDRLKVVWDGYQTTRYTPRPDAEDVCPWIEPRGCGQARHYGITTSTADVVILTDAHMTFPSGWVGAITKHLAKHPRDITCLRMQSLTPKWEPTGPVLAAAQLWANTDDPQADAFGPRREYHGIRARWRPAGSRGGTVSAPMGACYAMRREWYAAMGRPLGILESWGWDEEVLALAGWMCGGRTYCLPLTAGHVHAAPHVGRMADSLGRWANQSAVLHAVGAPREVIEHMRHTALPWDEIDRMVAARRERVEALRAHLAGQRRGWADAVAAGVVKELPAKTGGAWVARPAAVAPPVRVCRLCDRPMRRVVNPVRGIVWSCAACGWEELA